MLAKFCDYVNRWLVQDTYAAPVGQLSVHKVERPAFFHLIRRRQRNAGSDELLVVASSDLHTQVRINAVVPFAIHHLDRQPLLRRSLANLQARR